MGPEQWIGFVLVAGTALLVVIVMWGGPGWQVWFWTVMLTTAVVIALVDLVLDEGLVAGTMTPEQTAGVIVGVVVAVLFVCMRWGGQQGPYYFRAFSIAFLLVATLLGCVVLGGMMAGG
jgi:hypothetical protein